MDDRAVSEAGVPGYASYIDAGVRASEPERAREALPRAPSANADIHFGDAGISLQLGTKPADQVRGYSPLGYGVAPNNGVMSGSAFCIAR
jgi:hypothetical protein